MIVIEQLNSEATLTEVVSKIKELKNVNEDIKSRLLKVVNDNGIETNEDASIQDLIANIEELLKSPVPDIFKSEPGNPFGDELHSKIRYRDRDGLDRVVYSKTSGGGYPCYNDTTDILYFATKATFVQGYVYQNGEWEAISEAYYGYLPDGAELESVYSNSIDIGYHSTSSNYGRIWKAKKDI